MSVETEIEKMRKLLFGYRRDAKATDEKTGLGKIVDVWQEVELK